MLRVDSEKISKRNMTIWENINWKMASLVTGIQSHGGKVKWKKEKKTLNPKRE